MESFRSAGSFLKRWQKESAQAYHYQYGIFLALPLLWGCLDAFLWPCLATVGFIFSSLFLEGRITKRLALQAFLFVAWSLYLQINWPMHLQTSLDIANAPTLLTNPLEAATNTPIEGVRTLSGRINALVTLPRCSFVLSTSKGLIKVKVDAPSFELQNGQWVYVYAMPSPPLPPTNPGQFNYPEYLLSMGIREVYLADSITLVKPPTWVRRYLNTAHDKLDAILTESIPKENAPLIRACLLGTTDDLNPDIINDFKRSGMLHILAISGQHIALVALILLQLFSFLRLPRKWGFGLAAILIFIYVPISGGSVSVLRSALMFACVLPGIFSELPTSMMNNLAWSLIATLLFMPYQILSLGFQLSYLASFFLILYAKSLQKFFEKRKIKNPVLIYFLSTVVLGAIIYLGLYPLLANAVHTVAPSSLLGNLATIALSSGMLAAACLILLFSTLPFISQLFGETAGAFSHALSYSIHALAHGPGAAQSIESLPIYGGCFLWMLLLMLPAGFQFGYAKKIILIGLLGFSTQWAYAQGKILFQNQSAVSYLDVGQGDGILLQLPGATILIDAGPVPAGKNVILPFLRFHGINRIDKVIITHPDLDHYGGLEYLTEQISIGEVHYPGIESDAMAWKTLKLSLAKHSIPLLAAHRGEILYQNQEIAYSILSPQYANQFPERNDNSVITLLETPSQKFLFTGDMEGPGQQFLLSHNFPHLEGAILKVPHHGSDHSNPNFFLNAIHPNISILSAGRKNRFGHPGPGTVEALQTLGSKIFLTARQGEIECTFNAKVNEWKPFLPRAYNAPTF